MSDQPSAAPGWQPSASSPERYSRLRMILRFEWLRPKRMRTTMFDQALGMISRWNDSQSDHRNGGKPKW